MSAHLTRQQLRRRGWGAGLIDEYRPDEIVETASGRVAHLYARERIERLERLPEVAQRIAIAWGHRRDYANRMCRHYYEVMAEARGS